MSNMTRYDPFSEPMSDLFHGLFRPLRGLTTGDDAPLADMKLDVTESETAYTVKAESISATVQRNKDLKEGERVVRRERYSGAISRSFSLASEFDEASAAAQYQDGVLSLTLPKKAPSAQKRLQIG
jgi:HSP20 family protein